MMEHALLYLAYAISAVFELYIISKYMRLFLGELAADQVKFVLTNAIRLLACTAQHIWLPQPAFNMLIDFVTILPIAFCYGRRVFTRCLAALSAFMFMLMAEAITAAVMGISFVRLADGGHEEAFILVGVQGFSWIISETVEVFADIWRDAAMPRYLSISAVLLCAAIYILEISTLMQENLERNQKMLSVIFVMLLLFLAICLYDIFSRSMKKKMQAELMEREKNYYYKQAELLQKSSMELRSFRHDIKNHLYVLETMLGSGDEGAGAYLASLKEKLEKTKSYSNTGNLALDSVVNYKMGLAEQAGIRAEADIAVPAQMPFQADDLVSVLGNLLDNALEAQENVEDKYLLLCMKYKVGAVFITVRNSCDGEAGGTETLATRKADKKNHGIGLKIVRSLVEQYRGTMEIRREGKEFTVDIMMYGRS